MSLRTIPLLALAALALLTAAAASTSTGASSRYVHRGDLATISIPAPNNASCLATIVYADGGIQIGTVKQTQDSRLTWRLRVARAAALGRAAWTVRCGVSWLRTASFVVLRARTQ